MNLPTIESVLSEPSVSNWLKDALRKAIERDPVDAANDAEFLAELLKSRCDELIALAIPAVFGDTDMIHAHAMGVQL